MRSRPTATVCDLYSHADLRRVPMVSVACSPFVANCITWRNKQSYVTSRILRSCSQSLASDYAYQHGLVM